MFEGRRLLRRPTAFVLDRIERNQGVRNIRINPVVEVLFVVVARILNAIVRFSGKPDGSPLSVFKPISERVGQACDTDYGRSRTVFRRFTLLSPGLETSEPVPSEPE